MGHNIRGLPRSGTKPASAESSGSNTSIDCASVRHVVNSGAICPTCAESARINAVRSSAKDDQISPHFVLSLT